jgi:hypothetical protein
MKIGRKVGSFLQNTLQSSLQPPKQNPPEVLILAGFCECRGDWIRTSDLLNPIQAR